MLTTDLVRARLSKGEVKPAYLDAGDRDLRALADELIALYRDNVGRSRGELDDGLSLLVGAKTDFLLYRGLSKLLSDRSEFATASPCDPIELRRMVFEASAKAYPVALIEGDPVHPVSRAQVLAQVAAHFSITADDVERALYADLERAQVLGSFDPIDAESLLQRYNVALAQAVLLRASALEVTIAPGDPQRYRQLFRFIKFYRLMHGVRGDGESGYTITLDGPASLFQLSAKYGLQMAEFLPALLLCDGWKLRAELMWGKDRKPAFFALEAGSGLRSHYPDKGVYVTDEEAHLVKRFGETAKPWVLDKRPEIVDLDGRGVLVPDFVVRNEDDGREALLEIVGFWRAKYLSSRAELLAKHAPKNLVLAVSKRLRSSEDDIEAMGGAVVFFKDVIPVKEIVAQCERVAVASGTSAAKAAREKDKRAKKAAAKTEKKTEKKAEPKEPAKAAPKRAARKKATAEES